MSRTMPILAAVVLFALGATPRLACAQIPDLEDKVSDLIAEVRNSASEYRSLYDLAPDAGDGDQDSDQSDRPPAGSRSTPPESPSGAAPADAPATAPRPPR